MQTQDMDTGAADVDVRPVINDIRAADLMDSLKMGFADFLEKPSHVIFLCVIYPVVGVMFARLAAGNDILPLIFPMIAGFALLGPLAATGLYELSRRREKGLSVSWKNVFDVVHSPSRVSLALLGALLMVIFIAWLATAQAIHGQIFGAETPSSIEEFVIQVFFTKEGWWLIVAGSGAGFLFALLVLGISVISLPMLLDRDVGFWTAVTTSVRALVNNPMTMSLWGLMVTGSLILASIPLFIGLAVVMPVLGHATWHLYRRTVAY